MREAGPSKVNPSVYLICRIPKLGLATPGSREELGESRDAKVSLPEQRVPTSAV